MCESKYKPIQFDFLIYEHNSGGLSTPSGMTRFAYYGVGSVPTLKFDGTATVVGGSSNGSLYMPVIDAHHNELVPLALAFTDWSFTVGDAYADVWIKLLGDLDDIANSYVRIAIVEDYVTYGSTSYRHIQRDMLPDQPLTVSLAGQEQLVHVPMTISGSWNQSRLSLVAWVQRDSDRYVFNSTNTKIGPYAVVARVDGPAQKILADGEATFEDLRIYNMGRQADIYELALDTSALPAGWSAYLTYAGQDAPGFEISLDSFATADLSVTIVAPTNGSGRVDLSVLSQGADEVMAVKSFAAMAAGAEVLIVSDDAHAGFAGSVYGAILDGTSLTYAIWERELQLISGADLLDYAAVIWTTGANLASLQASDRDAIDAYLAAGGRLILAGENILQGLNAQGTAGRNWFINQFRFNYGGTYSGSLQIVGVADDPLGDGLGFTLTGGDPDRLTMLGGEQPIAVSCHYGNGVSAVVRTFREGFKSVFLPFGLELVPTQGDRDLLLKRSLEWLDVLQITPVPHAPRELTELLPNRPNPFNPATEIVFSVGRAGPARLEVFNARGQLVRVLVDETLPAGRHAASWDGRSSAGQPVASGTYYYRLSTDSEQQTRKMSLIK